MKLAIEKPPSCLMAGYIISGVTAAKLTLKVKNIDPDTFIKGPLYADYFSPPPGTQLFGEHKTIKDSIRKYMIASGFEASEAGVDMALTGLYEELKTIIVTQSGLIPHGFEGSRPEIKIGKREDCVRRWLEENDTFFPASLLTCSHTTYPQVSTRNNTSGGSVRNPTSVGSTMNSTGTKVAVFCVLSRRRSVFRYEGAYLLFTKRVILETGGGGE